MKNYVEDIAELGWEICEISRGFSPMILENDRVGEWKIHTCASETYGLRHVCMCVCVGTRPVGTGRVHHALVAAGDARKINGGWIWRPIYVRHARHSIRYVSKTSRTEKSIGRVGHEKGRRSVMLSRRLHVRVGVAGYLYCRRV